MIKGGYQPLSSTNEKISPTSFPVGGSPSEQLANAAAEYLRRAEKAEAERDAQHDQVLRLTAERDEAKADAVRMLTAASQPGITSARLAADLDEARAQVWGLICIATNGQWRERDQTERTQRNLSFMGACLDEEQRKVAELTATRDLLTAENARLQKERDALLWVKKASVKLLDALQGIRWMEPHEPDDEQVIAAARAWVEAAGLTMHAELLETIKDLRAQVATLELLRRGGK